MGQPSTPVAGVRVVLEEQRLNNGVLNAFYTEIEEANTDASGVVELETVRSNVLSIRIRAEKEGCFTEIVELNPRPSQRPRPTRGGGGHAAVLHPGRTRQHQFTLP